MTVAATILAQLGGYRFAYLVKLYDRREEMNKIAFSFMGSDKANRCVVSYNSAWDCYNMAFYKGKVLGDMYVEIYADQLQDIFQSSTGINLETVIVRFG